MVPDGYALVEDAGPQELQPVDMNGVARQPELIIHVNIRICQVDCQQRVVIENGRAQQQRSLAIKPQFQARKKPRIAMIKAVWPAAGRNDISVLIEQREGIAVLESTQPPF